MSTGGLDRVDKGWHSVDMDCTNIYYRELPVIVMKQYVNKYVCPSIVYSGFNIQFLENTVPISAI